MTPETSDLNGERGKYGRHYNSLREVKEASKLRAS